MSLTLLKGKALSAEIKAIAKDAKTLQKRLHSVAVSVCVEAFETGNLTHMMQFDTAVEHIGRRAMRRWLDKHGPAKWDTKEKKFTFVQARRDAIKEKGVEDYAEELFDGPDYVAESTASDTDSFHAFDVLTMLKSIVRRHDKVTDVNDPRHHFDGYDKVVALAAEIEGARASATSITKADGEVPFTPDTKVIKAKTSKKLVTKVKPTKKPNAEATASAH